MKPLEVTLEIVQDQVYYLQFVGGGPCTVEVGTTTTLPPGSMATVVNVGTSTNAILNFGIPRGDTGADGETGGVSPSPGIAPVISTTSIPGGAISVEYAYTLQTSAGTEPITWSIVAGALPPGLTLYGPTGTISGTPLGPVGNSTVTVSATNLYGGAEEEFTITIDDFSIPPVDPFYLAGEWPYTPGAPLGGIPAAFTENQLLNILRNGDSGPPPRTGLMSAIITGNYADFNFPETALPTFRVLVVPQGQFDEIQLPPGTPAGTTPFDSTVYQPPITVAGQVCDVYVLMIPDPGAFSVATGNPIRGIIDSGGPEEPPPSEAFYVAGEWPYTPGAPVGGLPAAFTQAQIMDQLMNGDGGPPARTGPILPLVVSGHVDFDFPETAQPTFRVLVVPQNYFSQIELPPGTPAGTTPLDSTVYQPPISINGQMSDIYVLMIPDPGAFSVLFGNPVRGVI